MFRNVQTVIKEFPKIDAQPITLEEFNEKMQNIIKNINASDRKLFDSSRTIGIGVSGGPDSMALAVLAKRWAEQNDKDLFAIIVDHKIRPESSDEAQFTKNELSKMGIPSKIAELSWKDEDIIDSPKIELRARLRRYDILQNEFSQMNIQLYMLAHQLNDHIETIIYRFAFCSSLHGLAGMANLTIRPNFVSVGRPLLDFEKDRLKATCIHYNQKWVEDPMNQMDTHARTKIRKYLKEWHKNGITLDELAQVGKFIGEIRSDMVSVIQDFYKTIKFDPMWGYATIRLNDFKKLKKDVAVRVLLTVVQKIRNTEMIPRFEPCQAAYDDIMKGNRRTFGGCICVPVHDILYIARETPGKNKRQYAYYGQEIIFDDRFKIFIEQYNPNIDHKLRLKKLEQTNKEKLMLRGEKVFDSWYPNKRIPHYDGKVDTNPDSKLIIRPIALEDWETFSKLFKHLPYKLKPTSRVRSIPSFVRSTTPLIEDEKGILAVPLLNYYRQRDVYVKCELISVHQDLPLLDNFYD